MLRTLNRILAVTVMVISTLVLILSVVAIVGTWRVRAQVAAELVTIATAADMRLIAVAADLDRLEAGLDRARDAMTTLEQDAQAVVTDLDETAPLLTGMSERLDIDLLAWGADARELVASLREAAAAVNGTIEAINALPFVSEPVLQSEALNRLSDDIDGFVTGFDTLLETLERRRTEVIENAVALISQPATEIGILLDSMLEGVSGLSAEVATRQARVAELRSIIGRWLIWTAVGFTLILSWLAFSQVAVLLLAWRVLQGQPVLPDMQRAALA